MPPRRLKHSSSVKLALATLAAAAQLLAAAPGQAPAARLKLLSLTPGQLNRREATAAASVPRYDLPANRLVFMARDIHLVVEVGIDFDDQVFRINGLLNPDIQVVRGARLTVLVVSEGTPSDFAVLRQPPPFPQSGLVGPTPRRRVGGVSFPVLPPLIRGSDLLYTVTQVYLAQTAGVAWWGNGGWAAYGCYGRIIVTP